MKTSLRPIEEIVTEIPVSLIKVQARQTPEEAFQPESLKTAYEQNMLVRPLMGSETRIQNTHITACGNVWVNKQTYDCDF